MCVAAACGRVVRRVFAIVISPKGPWWRAGAGAALHDSNGVELRVRPRAAFPGRGGRARRGN